MALLVVLLAPHLRPVARVHKLDTDQEVFTALRDTARQDRFDAQCFGYFLRVSVFTLVLERGAAGDDLHTGKLREAVDEALANAVGEVFGGQGRRSRS